MLLSLALWTQATGFFTCLRGSGYVYPCILSLPMVAILITGTIHVLNGALTLAASVVLTMQMHRNIDVIDRSVTSS